MTCKLVRAKNKNESENKTKCLFKPEFVDQLQVSRTRERTNSKKEGSADFRCTPPLNIQSRKCW
ncbi:unnamed protein product, partial [Larinioides sclopetarius]